ncbi:7359_t:CDS:2 [Funneliformis mosseae]|uniref:7359_t:CDS:1 n=1 Tax=Funneliformis mosseae TaxID=27381 RepID=A0A9N8YUC0_FUNMO|nr:7359_t:CDS:2 [Funneliformis mosseae]
MSIVWAKVSLHNDFVLIQTTLNNNHNDDETFNKQLSLYSQQQQNQVSTPPTSPFLYVQSPLSCETSFSPCSSTSLSPIHTPTATNHSFQFTTNSSLPSSPIFPTEDTPDECYESVNGNDHDLSLTIMEQYQYNNESLTFCHERSNNFNTQPTFNNSNQEQIYSNDELFESSYERYNNDNDNKVSNVNPYIQSSSNHNIYYHESTQQLQSQSYILNARWQQNQYHASGQLKVSSIECQLQHLKHKDPCEERYVMDPGFVNSDLNVMNWTFIKPNFPLIFDQMYDKADGCFFLEGIPSEFIFDFRQHSDLLIEGNFVNEDFG